MAINPVQFQSDLSMAGFIERYGAEAKCYRAMYKTRWLNGFQRINI